ncbi:MAG: hypothetical protein FWH18_09415 [Marinilabiliaceae bacterium]|nr:hypothetical protein [Marinilabiliaceae bacterium]
MYKFGVFGLRQRPSTTVCAKPMGGYEIGVNPSISIYSITNSWLKIKRPIKKESTFKYSLCY